MTSFSHHLAGGLQMCEEKSEAQEDVTVDSALLVMPCPVYPVFNACLRDKLNYIPDQSTESWPKRTRKKVAAVRLELCFQNLFMAAFIHLKLLCAHTHMIATVIKCWSNEFCIILLCQIPTGIVDFAVKDKVMKIQNIASSFITRKTATQVPDSVGSSL
jgi:hypothetical protein